MCCVVERCEDAVIQPGHFSVPGRKDVHTYTGNVVLNRGVEEPAIRGPGSWSVSLADDSGRGWPRQRGWEERNPGCFSYSNGRMVGGRGRKELRDEAEELGEDLDDCQRPPEFILQAIGSQ